MIPSSQIETLFQEHFRSGVFYAHRMVGVKEVAEDIVQSVFLRMMGDDVSVSGSLTNYFYSAVRHRCIDYLRGRREIFSEDEVYDMPSHFSEETDAEIDHHNSLLRAFRIKRLYEAIEQLPPQCRRVFLLVELEQNSYAGTARILGISLNTVRTQMYRAFRFLKTTLRVFILFSLLQC